MSEIYAAVLRRRSVRWGALKLLRLTAGSANLAALTQCIASAPAIAADTASQSQNQTIVFMRHGEKPAGGLGQLDCQGLNRSLALPNVLAKKFDKPAAIFAPKPSQRTEEAGLSYNYIRPLATIEPTAIALGMPVNVDYDATDIKGLEAALGQPALANGTVLVAWEHKMIVKIAADIVADFGGNVSAVKKWKDDEFDLIYVLRISRSTTASTVVFEEEHEGLNGQPAICPNR